MQPNTVRTTDSGPVQPVTPAASNRGKGSLMTRQTNYDPRWGRHGEALVLVANSGKARIFRRLGKRFAPELQELASLERPTAHLHARDLTTDLAGRRHSTAPPTSTSHRTVMHHGTASDYDPQAVEIERFAQQLAARLSELARHSPLEELVVIAEPRFLGVLRRKLPELLHQRVSREVTRDLTSAPIRPIAEAAFALPAAPPGAGG